MGDKRMQDESGNSDYFSVLNCGDSLQLPNGKIVAGFDNMDLADYFIRRGNIGDKLWLITPNAEFKKILALPENNHKKFKFVAKLNLYKNGRSRKLNEADMDLMAGTKLQLEMNSNFEEGKSNVALNMALMEGGTEMEEVKIRVAPGIKNELKVLSSESSLSVNAYCTRLFEQAIKDKYLAGSSSHIQSELFKLAKNDLMSLRAINQNFELLLNTLFEKERERDCDA